MVKGNENVLRKEKEKATRPNGLETTPPKRYIICWEGLVPYLF